ncbi:DUF4382 domain-containing protein [Vibrio sp. SS-MA-C1-2]|uniref:DUF4382 domain-containing protein n=1 Tax=Vibrio sp. SS-MA-C1-2 TaxID=2908646 RepID=UPI001F48FC19|nr:DUF4382 domain-containing protein [Vibrio sp. SS-MA-C1-2]UJF17470.1 DUF4382 domain-containing protein [Vibrio sp. SS-MA-C1-2]
MKKLTLVLSLITTSILLSGCNSSSSSSPSTNNSTQEIGSFTLNVSDAPVDQANHVVTTFSEIVLVPVKDNSSENDESRKPFYINTFDEKQVDLLQYQGENYETIISSLDVPIGDYTMCLYVKNGVTAGATDRSYVDTDDGILPLVVENQGSCSGIKPQGENTGRLFFNKTFSINSGYNSFLVDFDLRKGLTKPTGQDLFKLKPTAVQLTNLGTTGSITGSITEQQMSACINDTQSMINGTEGDEFVHAAYLYAGEMDRSMMGDAYDTTEQSDLSKPVAIANILGHDTNNDGEFDQFDYYFPSVGAGNYSIAYTCVANNDDPDNIDLIDTKNINENAESGFMFYQHYTPVTVEAAKTTTQNLTQLLF